MWVKQFHPPIQKSEKMPDYYYKQNDFLQAAPLLILCTVIVLVGFWVISSAEKASSSNTLAIQSLHTTVMQLQKDMREYDMEINKLAGYVTKIAEMQDEFLTVVRENNSTLRLLEQHPLLRDDFDDFGRRVRRER